MNYIETRKKLLQINFKAIRYIKTLDWKFLRNLAILSVLKVIKNWFIFIILFMLSKNPITKRYNSVCSVLPANYTGKYIHSFQENRY